MDARQEEEIITIPAGPDESEDEVKAKAAKTAAEKWGVKIEKILVECLEWHGPADRVSTEQSAVEGYAVTVSISS